MCIVERLPEGISTATSNIAWSILDSKLTSQALTHKRTAIKANGQEYFECALLHEDDAFVVISENSIRKQIGKYFHVKPNSVGPPSVCLGGGTRKALSNNASEA